MIRARWVATAVVAAIVTLGCAAPAMAQTAPPDPTLITLDWDGTTAGTADESFVGVPVAVPGDRAVRALQVRNDGPATGVLRAWVQQVELLEPAQDDGFYDDLRLDWDTAAGRQDASFRDLAQTGRTQITQTELEPGESTVLAVGYTFPVAATTGNRSLVGAREVSFVVHLDLRGELPSDGGTAETPDGPEPGAAEQPTPGGGAPWRPGGLATTGADALYVALVAAAGIGLGGVFLAAARRTRRVDGAAAACAAPPGT